MEARDMGRQVVDLEELWSRVLENVKRSISQADYRWFDKSLLYKLDNGNAVILVPDWSTQHILCYYPFSMVLCTALLKTVDIKKLQMYVSPNRFPPYKLVSHTLKSRTVYTFEHDYGNDYDFGNKIRYEYDEGTRTQIIYFWDTKSSNFLLNNTLRNIYRERLHRIGKTEDVPGQYLKQAVARVEHDPFREDLATILEVPEELQSGVIDIIQSFETYATIKGYNLRAVIDRTLFNECMVIGIALAKESSQVESQTVKDDFRTLLDMCAKMLQGSSPVTYENLPKDLSGEQKMFYLALSNKLTEYKDMKVLIADLALGSTNVLAVANATSSNTQIIWQQFRTKLSNTVEELESMKVSKAEEEDRQQALGLLKEADAEASKPEPRRRVILNALNKAKPYTVTLGQIATAINNLLTLAALDKHIF